MLKAQRRLWVSVIRSAALIGILMGFLLFIGFCVALQACEEDPRREQHLQETDRLLALGDQELRVDEYYKWLEQPKPEEKSHEINE